MQLDTSTRWAYGAIVLLSFALSACQRLAHVEYVAPAFDVDAVLGEIRDLAVASGMQERMTAKKIKGGLLYFTSEPTRTSFTDLGVRQIDDKVIVDLILRTAGLEAKIYDELHSKLEQLLKRRYGSEVVVVMDRAQMVPIENEDA